MFLTSKDIGISLQGGELCGTVCVTGESKNIRLEDLSFSRGKALVKEPLEKALKELFASLVPKLKFIAPRVIFTGFLDSEGEREFVKNRIIEAGARDLILLERAMAVCLGNEGPLAENEKRVYLLWDDGVLECAALEGVQTISLVRIETERICSLNSSFDFTAIDESACFTDNRISFLASHLESLRKYGFAVENPFIWSPQALPKSLLNQIDPLFSELRPVASDAPLKGIVTVQQELKTLLKGPFKKR
jgi:hypothetical protein